jgi:hypothetical protein
MKALFRRRSEEPEHPMVNDIARLLPRPEWPDLPADRADQLKEHLMHEVVQDRPDGNRRRRLAAIAVPAIAACAVAVGVGMGGLSDLRDWTGLRANPDPQQTLAAPPPVSSEVARFLERVALVAAKQPASRIRDDQYTYIKVTGFSTALNGDNGQTERTDESQQEWTSVDGHGRTLQRNRGGDQWLSPPGKGSLNAPTYQTLQGLPTDPSALLKMIYADTKLNHGVGTGSTTGPDQEAFVTIGDMLGDMPAPPQVSAALYRAAARIPGVTIVPGAVDAAGRKGIAVARDQHGTRTEWIFNKTTLRLLGTREVLLKNGPWGKVGTTVTSTAILDRGIVDKAGDTPHHTN